MEQIMRVPEVAELTGVSESTLRFWRSTGQGPKSAKLGRRIVYRLSDVEAWVDAQFDEVATDR
jgi:predicted DNA-binding transcriptional regulator AlpA